MSRSTKRTLGIVGIALVVVGGLVYLANRLGVHISILRADSCPVSVLGPSIQTGPTSGTFNYTVPLSAWSDPGDSFRFSYEARDVLTNSVVPTDDVLHDYQKSDYVCPQNELFFRFPVGTKDVTKKYKVTIGVTALGHPCHTKQRILFVIPK